MNVAVAVCQISSLMYGASSSFIRFLYVCSSLRRDVQSVYQRTHFTFTFICICEIFNVMNIISAIVLRYSDSKSKLPFILYNACLDPYTINFSKPFTEVMFFNQLIVYIFDFINIGSNLFLWRFLKKHEVSNTAAKTVSDKKKERKRNFVPANVGIFSIFLFFVNAAIFSIIYYQVFHYCIV